MHDHAGRWRCRLPLVPTSAEDEKRSVAWFQYTDYMEQTETTGDADEVWLVWPELRSAVTFEVMLLTAADFTLRFGQFVLRREMCAR